MDVFFGWLIIGAVGTILLHLSDYIISNPDKKATEVIRMVLRNHKRYLFIGIIFGSFGGTIMLVCGGFSFFLSLSMYGLRKQKEDILNDDL